MKTAKYHLYLNDYEKGVLVNSLLCMRNSLIAESKDAEPVNELILKVIDAPTKKLRMVEG